MTKEIGKNSHRKPGEKRSWRFLAWSTGSAAVGYIAHKIQFQLPENWRGDEGLWDVWSHYGNVPATVSFVSAAMISTALMRNELFYQTTARRALGTAAIGFALGCGANAFFEVPAVAESALVQNITPGTQPDGYDLLYGGATAVGTASLLGWAATRRESVPVPVPGSDPPSGL